MKCERASVGVDFWSNLYVRNLLLLAVRMFISVISTCYKKATNVFCCQEFEAWEVEANIACCCFLQHLEWGSSGSLLVAIDIWQIMKSLVSSIAATGSSHIFIIWQAKRTRLSFQMTHLAGELVTPSCGGRTYDKTIVRLHRRSKRLGPQI